MKTYLDALRNALKKTTLTTIEIEDILNDHREMIETALAEGLSEDDIEKRFGSPEAVAEQLLDRSTDEKSGNAPEKKAWKSYSAGETLQKVRLKLVNEDIDVKTVSGDHINIYFDEAGNGDDYEVSFADGVLTLIAPRISLGLLSVLFRHKSPSIRIELPEKAKLRAYDHKGVSGRTSVSGIRTEAFTFSSTSGDADFEEVAAETATFNTVSGDLEVNGFAGRDLKISLVSGDLTLKRVDTLVALDINSVSGQARINNVSCETCHLGTVSGGIKGGEFYPDKVSLRSISGDIIIKNKEKKDIEIVKKKTVSGKIDIDTGD